MSANLRPFQGMTPNCAPDSYIDPSAVLIGDITIGNDTSIWPLVAARGDVNRISIGNRTNVQDGSVLHVTRKSTNNPNGYPLIVGDDVTIGHKAMLHGCQIGHRVLVGMGAIVLDGAVIENDVIIAAGALVPPNKTLASGFLYVGSPAKPARELSAAELDFLPDSANNYVKLKQVYLKEGDDCTAGD